MDPAVELLLEHEDTKHILVRSERDDRRWNEELFLALLCTKCMHTFYIRQSDLYDHLTGKSGRPLEIRGVMKYKDYYGAWQLLYTLIS